MTDWGAHTADIAQWALGQSGDGQGVLSLDPIIGDHPIPLKNGMPTKDDHYNTSHNFHIRCMFPEDTEMNIVSKSRKETASCSKGAKATCSSPAENSWEKRSTDLRKTPFLRHCLGIYKGKKTTNHMENFFVHEGQDRPDFRRSHHHRAMTTCHLANISIRLGRKIKWDPKKEQVIGDKEANKWQSCKQRRASKRWAEIAFFNQVLFKFRHVKPFLQALADQSEKGSSCCACGFPFSGQGPV